MFLKYGRSLFSGIPGLRNTENEINDFTKTSAFQQMRATAEKRKIKLVKNEANSI